MSIAQPAVGCQATLQLREDPNNRGVIIGTAIGRGSCGTDGGPVDLLIRHPGGDWTSISNCQGGECRFEMGFGAYCNSPVTIDLQVTCSRTSNDGHGCTPDAPAFDTKTVSIDHANSLDVKQEEHFRASGGMGVSGTLHYRTPATASGHAIHYDLLYGDGTFARLGADTLGISDEGDKFFSVGPSPDGKDTTVIATLDSCGEVFSPVVFSASGDNTCDECQLNQPPGCASCAGEPIQLWDGGMQIIHTDPLPAFPGVQLTRKYDSGGGSAEKWFGANWSSMFDRPLIVYPTAPFGPWAVVWLKGSKRYVFRSVAGQWIQMWPRGKQPATLLNDGTSGRYVLQEPQRDIEMLIDPNTLFPVGYRSRSTGRELLITYAGGVPVHVSDSWGTFGWTINATGHQIDSISIDGTSLTWQYVYSGGLLTAVKGPGGAMWRTYTYSGSVLTEARDAAGRLLESHAYDPSGRATTSLQAEHDIQSVQYGVASRNGGKEQMTRVVATSGAVTNYWLSYIGGRARTVEIEGNCASCGVNNAVFAYKLGDGSSGGAQLFRMQDARGYVTEWTYDVSNRVTSITRAFKPGGCDPETDATRCHLGPTDLGTASLDATSTTETTSYLYDDVMWPDRPTTITRPSVSNPGAMVTETLVYDTQTGVVVTDRIRGWNGTVAETHITTTALYDGFESAAFAPGGAFSSAWLTLAQPRGLRKAMDGPRTDVSDVTQWVYYPIDAAVPAFWRGRVAAMRNALGHVARFENYDVLGNPGRIIDSNGVVTESTYDAIGRPLTSTVKEVPGCDTSADPLCATDLTTTRAYDATYGPLLSETTPNAATTTYEYDARGRLAAMTRPVSATLSERVEYDYDTATGNKSAERYLSGHPGSWMLTRSEAFRYDIYGRLIAIDHPDGTSILYDYDGTNNVINVQDERHTTPNTTYRYDPLSRLVRVNQTLAGATGGVIATLYAYDLHGNLTSVADPNGNVTAYTFDDFDRLKQQVSPVGGTTTYTYDLSRNLTATTDANGAITTRTYDALNRASSAVSTKGSASETVSWTYDDANSGHFGVGRMATMTDPTGSTSYRYERRGLLQREARTINGTTYATSHAYDADSNRSAMTYPSGRVVVYSYDLADRALTAASADATFVSSAEYLPFGPLTKLVYGNSSTATIQYDSRYRPIENKLSGPSGVISDYNYAEDAAGNITQIHDSIDPTYNRDFGYDDLNRLTTANTGTSLWGAGTYSYDRMGNMLSASLGSNIQNFSYTGTTPKLSTVTYDAAGNETLAQGRAETYSPRNLRQGFGYDGRGVRTSFELPGDRSGAPRRTLRAWYAPELSLLQIDVDEWDDSGFLPALTLTRVRDIVWFADTPVAQVDSITLPQISSELEPPETTFRFTFTDHLGTPIIQTDETSAVVWRAEFAPYGAIHMMRTGSADDQPLRLTGQDSIGGGDTYYNIFRWYRPGWGRFTQVDPATLSTSLGLTPRNERDIVHAQLKLPQLQHDYAYAAERPNNFADPWGLFVTPGGLARTGAKICLLDGPEPGPGDVIGVLLVIAASVWSEAERLEHIRNCEPCKQEIEKCKVRCDRANQALVDDCQRRFPGNTKRAKFVRALCYAQANDVYADCLNDCEGIPTEPHLP